MSNSHLAGALHLIAGTVYFCSLLVVLRKRGFASQVSRLLISYLGIAILWEGLQVGLSFGYRLAAPQQIAQHAPYYGLLLSAFVLLLLTSAFLRNEPLPWWCWSGGVLLFSIILFSDFYFADISLSASHAFLLVGGWVVCASWTVGIAARLYRQSELIVSRNRITYWILAVLLIFGGGLLFLIRSHIFGSLLNLLGALSIVYIIITHRLPDIKDTLKKLFCAVLTALLELAIYAIVIAYGHILFAYYPDFEPIVFKLGLATLLVLLFNPILRWLRKWLRKVIVGTEPDKGRIFSEYSKSIGSILDLNLLSTAAIGLISEELEVQRGELFTIDTEFGEDGQKRYRLKGVPGMEASLPLSAAIPLNSPIATILNEERRPLLQSEIDTLPEFRILTAQERSWINHQNMDVFVPIHAKDEWVGIFAVGPKTSGASYHDEDIALLIALANQTAVALQNARLVGSLVRINKEFRRAYSRMEEAHVKLEKIDRTKSDFISIASHELRTPLTVLSGYSQMLMDDPTFSENAYYAKVIAGIYDGTSRLHEIVDSMLDVAKIDTRALELQSEPIQISALLETVCQSYEKAIDERSLTLDIDDFDEFPSVPGDPEALKKVFHHLVMNAIKYTPDGGKIMITGSLLEERDARFPKAGLEIIISDTGIGIDPRFKDLIFTKFYQTGELALHSSGKTKFKGGGPGLGLAIVRGIVQAHGGRVWVDSPGYDEHTNPGSHFHILLPLSATTRISTPGELDQEQEINKINFEDG